MKRSWLVLLAVALIVVTAGSGPARAGSTEEYQELKKEIQALRKEIKTTRPVGDGPVGRAEALVGNKYGPNAQVTTRQGNLKIGGLLQVWFYTIQNDNLGWGPSLPIMGPGGTGYNSNEIRDNDSFRVRRAQLRFTMDIHENVTAYVMMDPAREALSFPNISQNQSSTPNAAAHFNQGLQIFDPFGGALEVGNIDNPLVQAGSGAANRLLQDAYIHYHGVIPHHDVKIGQFKRRLGEEGTRDSGQLDFIERSMITQLANMRDLGLQIHGTWWDDRFQYWLGTFQGAGTAFQQRQNRTDTNDEKDLVGTLLLRPLWKDETWGSIELGYSIRYGIGGEAGGHFGALAPVDGLNRRRTVHAMQYAWGMYKPGGPVRGWWMRGEWGQYRDRFAPMEAISVIFPGAGFGPGPPPQTAASFAIQGWFVSTGYKMADSRWAEGLRDGGAFGKHVLEPMEFTFRYDVMENLFFLDLVNPHRELDVFKTQVYTAGINYYIKGHNAKLQVNYNVVVEEDDRDNLPRQMREVRNNSLVVNFQVAW